MSVPTHVELMNAIEIADANRVPRVLADALDRGLELVPFVSHMAAAIEHGEKSPQVEVAVFWLQTLQSVSLAIVQPTGAGFAPTVFGHAFLAAACDVLHLGATIDDDDLAVLNAATDEDWLRLVAVFYERVKPDSYASLADVLQVTDLELLAMYVLTDRPAVILHLGRTLAQSAARLVVLRADAPVEGERMAIDRAIQCSEFAELVLRPGTTAAAHARMHHGNALVARAEWSGPTAQADLDAAITLFELAEETLAETTSIGATCRMHHAAAVRTRADWGGSGAEADLDTAIALCSLAEGTLAVDTNDGAGCRMTHANALLTRAEWGGPTARPDIDEAIELYAVAEVALDLTTLDGAICRMNHASALLCRAEWGGSQARVDLDAAVELLKAAETTLSANTSAGAHCRMNRGTALLTRAEWEGADSSADLDEAIDLFIAAEEVLPETSDSGAACRMNHADALSTRAERGGSMAEADLDQAVMIYTVAEETLPLSSYTGARCRMNHASALWTRASWGGFRAEADLDAAISLYAMAEDTLPVGITSGAISRTNHGMALLVRAEWRGQLPCIESGTSGPTADLTAAITLFLAAEETLPATTVAGAQCRVDHANALKTRAVWGGPGFRPDLDAAISYYLTAEETLPLTTNSGAHCRVNHANALSLRAGLGGPSAIADLDEAIQLLTAAEGILEPSSPDGVICRMNTARALGLHFQLEPETRGAPLVDALRERLGVLETIGSQLAEATYHPHLQQRLLVERAGVHRTLQTPADNLKAEALLREAVALLDERLASRTEQADQFLLQQSDGDADTALLELLLDLWEQAGEPGSSDSRTAEELATAAWLVGAHRRARATLRALTDLVTADEMAASGQDARRIHDEFFDLLRKLSRLDGVLTSLDRALNVSARHPHPTINRRELVEERDATLKAYATTRIAVATAAPWLGSINPHDDPDLETIQASLRSLGEGTRLLELIPLEDSIAVLVLDGRSVSVNRLPVASRLLSERSAAFLEPIWNSRDQGLFRIALGDGLAALAFYLAPIVERLFPEVSADDNRVPYCFLVPSGMLQFWPLHALPLAGGARLIDRAACSILPSAAALPVLAAAAESAQVGPWTTIAPAFWDGSRLPFAGPQAVYEAARTCGTAYVGDAATFGRLRELRGGVVSVSTHSWGDPGAPEKSWVDFGDGAGGIESVTAVELLALRGVQLRLLQLWGCSAHGAGSDPNGGNWLGLTRAMLLAAPGVLTTLFPVPDLATCLMQVPLHDAYQAGCTAPQALRAALRALRGAGGAQLLSWAEQVAATLTAPDRADFEQELQRLGIIPELAPAFADPAWWGSYLAIGWAVRP